MDPHDHDFEESDSASKTKARKESVAKNIAKAASRTASAAKALFKPAPKDEPEEVSVDESPKPQQEQSGNRLVDFHLATAGVIRDRRILQLARKHRDVQWLLDENARLRKELADLKK